VPQSNMLGQPASMRFSLPMAPDWYKRPHLAELGIEAALVVEGELHAAVGAGLDHAFGRAEVGAMGFSQWMAFTPASAQAAPFRRAGAARWRC